MRRAACHGGGAAANGKTVVLFHGKNFCAAAFSQAGYRVIAVDQIGFCKSSKPAHYQFSFQQLAGNTHALLASLGITRATIIGHSIGGMLGMRYALTFPDDVEQLVLVNPIGLEDWKAKGVPWQSVDAWYQQELKTTADSIRDYQRSTYTPVRGTPSMSVGCKCWQGSIAVPGTTSSPGTRLWSTTWPIRSRSSMNSKSSPRRSCC
ncbi:MAG: alpha/beta hydrolase [Xanthobacteraceae bacterium]